MDALWGALVITGVLAIAAGVVTSPAVITGAVLGTAVLAVAFVSPLALVALMLVIGPVDLSFLTGGFKALLPGMGGLDMNGIRLIGATVGFSVFILFEPRSRAAAMSALGKPWLAFLAMASCTLLISMNHLEGLRLLFKLAYPFLTFLIVVGVARNSEDVERLVTYTLVAALIYTVAINPILALNGGYRYDPDGSLRVGGLGMGDNAFGFYVTAMLMITFSRALLRRSVAYLLFSVVLMGWIALTGSRIAAVAALVGLGILGVLTAVASRNQKMVLLTVGAIAVAAAVMIPNVLQRSLGFVPSPGELFNLVRNPLTLYNSVNWMGRELLWAILWGAFMSSPIIGLGLGSSTAVIMETFPNQNVRVAHNEYMRIATDTGLLGLTLMTVALGVWLVALVRMTRNSSLRVREFTFPAIAVLIAWALIAATDNAIDYYGNFSQYLGFLMAGAAVAYAEAEKGKGIVS
jgi:O-antigen ligase